MPERSKGADLRSAGLSVRVGSNPTSGMWCPSGQMDKASVSGAEDCGFESHLGCILLFVLFYVRAFVVVDQVGKKKIVYSHRGSNSGPLAC